MSFFLFDHFFEARAEIQKYFRSFLVQMKTLKIVLSKLTDLYQFYFRYGDSLNPWGDLIAMARAWCVLKPGGKALIGKVTKI